MNKNDLVKIKESEYLSDEAKSIYEYDRLKYLKDIEVNQEEEIKNLSKKLIDIYEKSNINILFTINSV